MTSIFMAECVGICGIDTRYQIGTYSNIGRQFIFKDDDGNGNFRLVAGVVG